MGNAALAGRLQAKQRPVGGAQDAEEGEADFLADAVLATLASEGEALSATEAPGGGGGAPADVLAAFRKVAGVDLTGVPLHTGGAAQQAAASQGAEAMAVDGAVYAPRGAGDLETLVHEYAHVALGHARTGAPVRRRATGATDPGIGISGTLRKGNRGGSVEALQTALVRLGYMTAAQKATGPGIFGRRTHAAVTAFQAAQRITVDGIVGPTTQARLAAALAAKESGGGPGPGATRDTAALTGRPALREGMEGITVKALQQHLNEHGARLYIDGEFGPATARAVRQFQTANGLTPDGIVGPQTAAKLTGSGAKDIGADGGDTTTTTTTGGGGNVGDADPKGILGQSGLNPTVKNLARRTIETLQGQGHSPYLVEGVRSFARQNQLYAKGRTAPGQKVTYVRGGGSWHNYGLAVDIVFWNSSHTGPSWDGRLPWQALGRAGKAAGFSRWMGDSGWDFAHFEHHPNWGNSCYNLADTYHRDGYQAVWDKVM
jgi:peptidoglycan hydrolase-like protein with peptidoglycan-binding domain